MTFDPRAAEMARQVRETLIADGFSPASAAGVVGNLMHESDNFKADTEYGQKPGKGGRGWAQWTGPRRKSFEKFAEKNSLDPTSPEANMGYLMHEMKGGDGNHWSGGKSLEEMKKIQDPAEASKYFSEGYERPGVPHLERRSQLAQQVMDMDGDPSGGAPPQQQQQMPGPGVPPDPNGMPPLQSPQVAQPPELTSPAPGLPPDPNGMPPLQSPRDPFMNRMAPQGDPVLPETDGYDKPQDDRAFGSYGAGDNPLMGSAALGTAKNIGRQARYTIGERIPEGVQDRYRKAKDDDFLGPIIKGSKSALKAPFNVARTAAFWGALGLNVADDRGRNAYESVQEKGMNHRQQKRVDKIDDKLDNEEWVTNNPKRAARKKKKRDRISSGRGRLQWLFGQGKRDSDASE